MPRSVWSSQGRGAIMGQSHPDMLAGPSGRSGRASNPMGRRLVRIHPGPPAPFPILGLPSEKFASIDCSVLI